MNLKCCTYYSVYIKGLSHVSLVIVTIMINDGSAHSHCCFNLSLINTASFPKVFFLKNFSLRFHSTPLAFASIPKHVSVQTWSNTIYSSFISAWLHKCRRNPFHYHLIKTNWFVGNSMNLTNRWISRWWWNFLVSHRSFKRTLKVMCMRKQGIRWIYFLEGMVMLIPLQSNKVYRI